ncbi:MAG: phenylalanine--tRNA ligase subunit beta [Saprospiraceae bacterium]|nr:phenylalanine--tRNA ligase subunit beta [Saprospiraceae bacterium]
MKVSLNWLRDFLDIHKSAPEIADILTSLGLECEGWEEVRPSLVDLDKVLTGKVLTCERIPETDHLSATTVDVGDGVVRSIVCGAPNVAAGQKVFVAVPGANVFSKDGTLFTIGERKVKGVPSQGMICAQDELGTGSDHSGIMVLPENTELGISAAQWFDLKSDTVIEIGLTPNRADATNHIGVARDLLAWIRYHENPEARINLPDYNNLMPQATGSTESLEVTVENTSACPLYHGVVLTGLTVKDSPEWLQNRLKAVGQRPINNIVDITNYVRIEMGQPLHAFDLSKIEGRKVIVANLPAGTPFKTLDGVDRKLFAEDLMICDGLRQPMCIGGVFGGADSGVSEATNAIFLEAALFDARSIRRTMMRHGLRTDAAWTFEKGVDHRNTLNALQRAVALILELAGGNVSSKVYAISSTLPDPAKIQTEYQHINRLIGHELSREDIQRALKAYDMGFEQETATGFTAVIPTNKPDVTREADLVEEILRLHGLDNIPIPTQIRSSMEVPQHPSPDGVRNMASEFLVANGYLECMGMSLSNSAYYTGDSAMYPIENERIVYIHNTANQGLDCLRPTLLGTALETVVRNQHRQQADLRLFEFGKVYARSGEKFEETHRFSVLVTGRHSAESWQPAAKSAVDFYTLKTIVQNLLSRLGVSGFQETVVQEAPFQYALRYHRGPQELVTFGAVQPSVLKKMDVKNPVFFADFHFENLMKAVSKNEIQFAEWSKYPTVRRDLALVLDQQVPFADIKATATRTIKKTLTGVNLFDLFEDESKLGAGKKSYAVSFTFEDPEKTLQDKDIDALMNQLTTAFESKLGAQVRR